MNTSTSKYQKNAMKNRSNKLHKLNVATNIKHPPINKGTVNPVIIQLIENNVA